MLVFRFDILFHFKKKCIYHSEGQDLFKFGNMQDSRIGATLEGSLAEGHYRMMLSHLKDALAHIINE